MKTLSRYWWVLVLVLAVVVVVVLRKKRKRKKALALAQIPTTSNPPSSSSGAGSSSAESGRNSRDSFPLKKGSRGPRVLRVQIELNKKFKAGLQPDGIWGNATEKAVKTHSLQWLGYSVDRIQEWQYKRYFGNTNGLNV